METKPRRQRIDLGSIRISERDIAATRWIAEQYAVRTDQLAVMLALSPRTAYDWYLRMRRQGWIMGQIFNRKLWVWATHQGLTDCHLSFRSRPPTASSLEHLYGINQVRLWYAHWHREYTWVSERMLRQQAGPGKQSQHIPDGELHYQGARIAVEVELVPKEAERVREIVSSMLEGDYEAVAYICGPDTLTLLQRVRQSFRDRYIDTELQHRFTIQSLDSITTDLDVMARQATDVRRQQLITRLQAKTKTPPPPEPPA